jgi:hypothetical protein
VAAHRLVPGLLKLLLHRERILLEARGTSGEPIAADATEVFRNAGTWSYWALVSARSWRADSAPSATMPHRRLVEGLRPSVV